MQEQSRKFRILVVEDEVKVARALREGLERENYDVEVAATGEEGFFRVNAQEFDLVILDLILRCCPRSESGDWTRPFSFSRPAMPSKIAC